MLKIAMLYASWRAEGEEHSWPMAVHYELQRLGHEVRDYNLYHANGALNPKSRVRHYSDEGLNTMYAEIRQGWKPDIIFQMDYGQHHSKLLDKRLHPDSVWVLECG
jgi:hypothetical protein